MKDPDNLYYAPPVKAKLVVNVVGGRNLPSRDTLGKSDAFVEISLN